VPRFEGLSAILEAVEPGARYGVAVSGGSDSRALLVLAVEALGAARVEAASVDHGLRPEAADEVARVAGLCARLGVAHQGLCWRWDGRGNLQEAARSGRRAVLADWAHARGLAGVMLGHSLDDQAETVLMALSRGAGVDGLSAMPPRRVQGGLVWLRPLLGATRAELRALLQARGIGWDDDPSNSDPRFERVRMRALLAGGGGLDPRALAALATRMQGVRAALEATRAQAQCAHVREDRGTVLIDPATLSGEIRLRLFQHLLRALTHAPAPRRAALARWVEKGGPLCGAVLARAQGGWRLHREARAVAALSAPVGALWDGRWQAEGPGAGEIRALGAQGLLRLSQQARAGLHPHWRETGLPRAALAGLPAVWRGDDLIGAPLAGWANGWRLSAAPLPIDELSH